MERLFKRNKAMENLSNKYYVVEDEYNLHLSTIVVERNSDKQTEFEEAKANINFLLQDESGKVYKKVLSIERSEVDKFIESELLQNVGNTSNIHRENGISVFNGTPAIYSKATEKTESQSEIGKLILFNGLKLDVVSKEVTNDDIKTVIASEEASAGRE